MAFATIQSAQLASATTLGAARLSMATAVLAAFVAGTCGLIGAVVQGGFAVQQAKIAATSGVAGSQASTSSNPDRAEAGGRPDAWQLLTFAQLVDRQLHLVAIGIDQAAAARVSPYWEALHIARKIGHSG